MTSATVETSLRQRREATVLEHIDAENRYDPDATVATFSPTKASYDAPAFGPAGQVPDHDAVRHMWAGFFTAFADLHLEPGPFRHGEVAQQLAPQS
jgi:SnoaL-like domain